MASAGSLSSAVASSEFEGLCCGSPKPPDAILPRMWPCVSSLFASPRRREDSSSPADPAGARRISSKVVFWSVIWWQFGQLRLFNPTIEAFFPAWQERMPPGLALALRERNASGGQGYGSGS